MPYLPLGLDSPPVCKCNKAMDLRVVFPKVSSWWKIKDPRQFHMESRILPDLEKCCDAYPAFQGSSAENYVNNCWGRDHIWDHEATQIFYACTALKLNNLKGHGGLRSGSKTSIMQYIHQDLGIFVILLWVSVYSNRRLKELVISCISLAINWRWLYQVYNTLTLSWPHIIR